MGKSDFDKIFIVQGEKCALREVGSTEISFIPRNFSERLFGSQIEFTIFNAKNINKGCLCTPQNKKKTIVFMPNLF